MAQPPPRRNNAKRKSDDDLLIPSETIFTWDEVVGHDLKNRTVTVRVGLESNGMEKVTAELDMESFHHSSALRAISDYLADQLEQEQKSSAMLQLESWIEDIEAAITAAKADEEEMQHSLTTGEFALCCGKCTCPQTSDFVIRSGDDMFWHRFCCHNVTRCTSYWKSPADVASADVQDRLLAGIESDEKIVPQKFCDRNDIIRRVKAAARMDTMKDNETEDPDPSTTWHTNPVHSEFARRFYRHLKSIKDGSQPRVDGAVVIDLFSGISTFLVALKQLGIKMKKVVHVDHDMVAYHVTKKNHEDKGDSIEHIHIGKFETFEEPGKFDEFLEQIGRIDIIVGGPPCQDYSGVNAYREGAEGLYGRYLLMVGTFIRKVQQHQPNHPVWYLVENVYLRGDDLLKVCKAFGEASPILVDSYHFSPCHRKRHYLLNFPVSIEFNPRLDIQARCDDILEDGFALPPHEGPFVGCSETWSKANTLMASKSRLDDDRMLVFKRCEDPDDFEERTFTVTERERMMGLPDGYVSKPVYSLFNILKPVAARQCNQVILREDGFEEVLTWENMLDKEYHIFAGIKYRFKVHDNSKYYDLKMAPPVNGNKYPTEFFSDEEYAKHLIGNAVSVSVAEMLLRPLTDLFEKCEYPDYPYPYSWQLGSTAPLRPLEQQERPEMDVEADHSRSTHGAKPNGMLHHESNGTLRNKSEEEGQDDDDAAVAQDDEEEYDDGDDDGSDGHADEGNAHEEEDEELSHEDDDDDDDKQGEDDGADVAEEGDDDEDEEDDQAEINWSHVFIANRPERPPSPPATAYDELTEKYKMIYWV